MAAEWWKLAGNGFLVVLGRFDPVLEEKCKKEQNGFDGEGEPANLLTRQPKTLTRKQRKEGAEASAKHPV